MATLASPEHALNTSGDADAVWVLKEPHSNKPRFPKLTKDIQTDVCVVATGIAGIAGISYAYELVSRGVNVAMIEARELLSDESERNSEHLSSSLDASYTSLAS